MPKKKKAKKTKIIKKAKKAKDQKKFKPSVKSADKKSSITGPDEKPEIKKIKKQATEKKIYNLKDFVVYPKHGVGKIIAVEKATIGQIEIQFYKIFIEKEKLTLTVPINQQPFVHIFYTFVCISFNRVNWTFRFTNTTIDTFIRIDC